MHEHRRLHNTLKIFFCYKQTGGRECEKGREGGSFFLTLQNSGDSTLFYSMQ